MKNNLELNLIYRQVVVKEKDQEKSLYQILYLFSDAGHLSDELLQSVYGNPEKVNNLNYYFNSLEELGHFAISICREVMAPEVFVISNLDYNLGLEASSDLRSFREIFRRYGSVIENPDKSFKKKNLFKKIFNS